MDTERGPGYPRNPRKSADKIDGKVSADGHGRGTGYPCNPCKSVDKIDGRASADDADGHGWGTKVHYCAGQGKC